MIDCWGAGMVQRWIAPRWSPGRRPGIGKATAAALVARAYRVVGTSRRPQELSGEQRADGVEYLPLDLGDEVSIELLGSRVGPVDVLVNNAGESQSGPLEELPGDALRRLFRVNVLGPVRLTQLLLPGMWERRSGRVVMIGSMLASFPLAYRSSYVASKAALKGFSDGARHEYSPFGVWLTTVEPGSTYTGISARRTTYIAEGSPHRGDFDRMLAALDRNERTGVPVQRVAATIVKAIEATRPRAHRGGQQRTDRLPAAPAVAVRPGRESHPPPPRPAPLTAADAPTATQNNATIGDIAQSHSALESAVAKSTSTTVQHHAA